VFTDRETRDIKEGCLFLNSSGVRDHEGGMALQGKKLEVRQRFDKPELGAGWLPGAESFKTLAGSRMNGEDYGELSTQVGERGQQIAEPGEIVYVGRAV